MRMLSVTLFRYRVNTLSSDSPLEHANNENADARQAIAKELDTCFRPAVGRSAAASEIGRGGRNRILPSLLVNTLR
jgi:hypothetical protein